MTYFNVCHMAILDRVKGAIRANDHKRVEELFKKVSNIITDINRLKDIHDDSLAVVKSTNGMIRSAKELAEIEIPLVFKPLVMPRSIRFSLDALPKHPDLKDYTELGGAKSQVSFKISDLQNTVEEFKAFIGRNQKKLNDFKLGDVWKDQLLNDCLESISVKRTVGDQELRLWNNASYNQIRAVIPIVDVSNVINLFNYNGFQSDWVEAFQASFQLPFE